MELYRGYRRDSERLARDWTEEEMGWRKLKDPDVPSELKKY